MAARGRCWTVRQRLLDPGVRLLTITGVGGTGKTRLALQVAADLLEVFADGVYVINLAPVSDADLVASTIAQTLGVKETGAEPLRETLTRSLAHQQLLLVLDNFEHLRAAADLLTTLVPAAPDVKVLVTSREALLLQEEWRYPLGGLELPVGDRAGGLQQAGAVQLFVERARRVRPDFDLVAEQDAVVHICRLVEGMPLALELAAAWTRTLPCAVIARELTNDLHILASPWRNVPERHRSIHAAFDHSWKLLTAAERGVFMRLAVFRGSFGRAAAVQVAAATLPILTALVDKSLLQCPAGSPLEERYQVHELVRQYAAERLEQSSVVARQVRDHHCAYYAAFLQQREHDINGRRQREAVADIVADFENVRAAWHHAVDHRRVADLQRAAFTFYQVYDFQGRYHEGAALFERAVQALSGGDLTIETGPVLAEVLVCLGELSIRLGHLQHAHAHLSRSQAILSRLDVPPRPAGPGSDPLVGLGILACVQGQYADAARLGEEARRRHEARADRSNLMVAYYVLTNAAAAQGDYAAAYRHARQAYALADALHNRWFLAYIVIDLGQVAYALGDFLEARRHYQASYAIREAFGDPEGMAVALTHLGQVALRQTDHAAAYTHYERAVVIYRRIDDQGGLATALHGLGMTSTAGGAYAAAGQHLQEALQIAVAMTYAMRTLAILASLADLLLLLGHREWAVELLGTVLESPGTDRETNDAAGRLLGRCAAELAPDALATALQRGQTSALSTVVERLRIAVATGALGGEGVAQPSAAQAPSPRSATAGGGVAESLSAREIAVLRLIAAGRSNQEIADRLIISLGTAKWYVAQIFGKLAVHSRTQAVSQARVQGILS